jgi:4-aminobutyrate aminotransferase-like enzyme
MLKNQLTENSAARGEQALTGLRDMMKRHPSMGDVRGRGLMFGFEFVQDRATRQHFPPELKVSALYEQAALRRGLVTYPCTGTVNGGPGDMVLMAPPLTITEQEMTELLGIMDLAVGDVEQALKAKAAATPVARASEVSVDLLRHAQAGVVPSPR